MFFSHLSLAMDEEYDTITSGTYPEFLRQNEESQLRKRNKIVFDNKEVSKNILSNMFLDYNENPTERENIVLGIRLFNLSIIEYKKNNINSNKISFEYLCKAASLGHSMAQNNLGVWYELGIGTSKNIELAKEWYVKSANNGNKKAKESLKRINK